MSKAVEAASSKLESGDEILKHYYSKLNGKDGALVMSKKKYVFVEGKGIFRKTYTPINEIPYETIDEMVRDANTKMSIKTKDGNTHLLTTFKLPVEVIKSELKRFLEEGIIPEPE